MYLELLGTSWSVFLVALGFQVGAMLGPNLIKKWIRKTIEIQMPLGSQLFGFWGPFGKDFGGQNRAKLESKWDSKRIVCEKRFIAESDYFSYRI